MGNAHGVSHVAGGHSDGELGPTADRTDSPFRLRPSKQRKKSAPEVETPAPKTPSQNFLARRVRSFSHVGHASNSSTELKAAARDAHTAARVNTTNGIAHKSSPAAMSPSQSNHSFASLRSNHSFHSFHMPHIKFHSFHGNHEHSKSWQVLEELATQPGFRYDLGQFEQIKQIGSGAFGRVLLCKHKLTGQKVVLKAIDKKHVIRTRQQHHLQEERNALKDLSEHHCPFVVHTVGCFQDDKRIYFVMEYVPGGELFAHLKASSNHHFSEKRTRFYIAEAVLALQHMHEKEHLVYRDIKPENCLLDEQGHLKIVDFGFAKHLDIEERTYTFCGTPDYLPPEVVLGKGSGRQADYWALGVLTYELLVGHAPFVTYNGRTGETTYEDILKCQPRFPKWVSPTAKDFILRLLTRDPEQRLGSKGGMEEIKAHEWFNNVDWDAMLRMEVRPPKLGKCKKGTVNIQPPKPKNARESEEIQLDDESKELFQSFDFVVRADNGDQHDMGRIEEETEEGAGAEAAAKARGSGGLQAAAPATATTRPGTAQQPASAQFFIDEDSDHESSDTNAK